MHINPHGKDETVQGTLEDPAPCLQSMLLGVCGRGNELAPYSIPKPLDKDSDNNSNLKRDLVLAFKEQEKLALATIAPSSLAHCRSTRPL